MTDSAESSDAEVAQRKDSLVPDTLSSEPMGSPCAGSAAPKSLSSSGNGDTSAVQSPVPSQRSGGDGTPASGKRPASPTGEENLTKKSSKVIANSSGEISEQPGDESLTMGDAAPRQLFGIQGPGPASKIGGSTSTLTDGQGHNSILPLSGCDIDANTKGGGCAPELKPKSKCSKSARGSSVHRP